MLIRNSDGLVADTEHAMVSNVAVGAASGHRVRKHVS